MSETNAKEQFAFLGPRGTHSEFALLDFAQDVEIQPCLSLEEVFRAVLSGTCSGGFIPVENLLQGPVTETLDLLNKYRGEVHIEVSHSFSIKNAIGHLTNVNFHPDNVRRIYSHQQPLSQCSNYLAQTFPKAQMFPVSSTGFAVKVVSEERLVDALVIGPRQTLLENGFTVIADDISDARDNKTRFLLIRKGPVSLVKGHAPLVAGNFVTSIVVDPGRDRKGLLHDLLSVISVENEVNLLSIHSRPDSKGGFVFHLDLEGALSNAKISRCVAALSHYAADILGQKEAITVLGSYSRAVFYQPVFKSITVVGGKGKMGSWFVKFFREIGFEVFVVDLDTTKEERDRALLADVILLSIPMSSVEKFSRAFIPQLKSGQLVVENCSVKTCALPHMIEVAGEGVEVLGIHTMFGGDVSSIRGENLVITNTELSGAKAQAFEDLLHKHGARITRSSVAEHDLASSYVQSLNQFVLVALAQVMRELFPSAKDVEVYSTPNSRSVRAALERVVNQNDELLVDLQTCNPQAIRARHKFLEIIFSLVSTLDTGDFSQYLTSAKKSKQFIN